MVELFGLAMIWEIRDHIISITDCYRNSWEVFSHALKDEYFLKDADRVTKKLFLEWIERPNKNLQATELLREFERQYSQLSKVEKLTLEPNKVDLFLQVADGELQEKLEPLLEDKEEDEGLTTKWKNVEDTVGLLTKKERRKDRSNIPKTVQAPKALVRTTPPTMPTVQPSTSLSKKADMGWKDPVESLSVHAYIAKSQHEALMEEKRRGNFDDTREGNSSKRQTQRDKAREAASQELPVKDTSASLGEKTKETKDKGKSIANKLLSDIEAATNLKGVLEERILNAKVEFTLKEVLGIAKKEFHDVIIDSIKRKRICRDEEEVDIDYKQPTNEKNGYNQRVRFEDSSDKEIETLNQYTRKHWARATTEVLVKPIDMEHGWAIRAANNTRGELYGACPDVKIRIGDVATEQHFFVQDTTSYPLILGQPYIIATWMETKVLEDGFAYVRVRSKDGRKAV
uniref:Predicted protein n=1 Tax=Physcomitrium patens TaxID=3218 RepID=A9U5K5_PHYPA